jgi:hypothetical protein
MRQPMTKISKRLGAGAALLAAGLIAAGTLMPTWWVGERGDTSMAVGLREAELCGERGCRTSPISELGSGKRAWLLTGATSFAIGCVAVVFLLGAAILALAGRSWAGPVARIAAGLSLFALALGLGFAWTFPEFDGLAPGLAAFLYLGGGALGTGSAGVLLRR